jgi:hypothetical protein
MKTVLCIEQVKNDEIVWKETGTLTDLDIFAMEGQEVKLGNKNYVIQKIGFEMTETGSHIDTVKHIHLQEEEE